MNVSVNASATPFQQPSGYGSHGYSTGKRSNRASFSAAVTDSGRAHSQSHWLCKGTALFLPPAVRENGHGATCRSFDSPWKGPGLFCIHVWSRFEECPAAGWLGPWTHVRELKLLNCLGFVWFFRRFVGVFFTVSVINRTIIIPDLSLGTCLTPVFGKCMLSREVSLIQRCNKVMNLPHVLVLGFTG